MFRRISGGSFVVLALACSGAAPILAQTVASRDSPESQARVSKVDALTIKQTTAAAFMKINDIKGESKDPRHREEIDVLAWSWSSGRDMPAQAGSFTITKRTDRSSSRLAEAGAKGRRLGQVTMTLPAREGERARVVTFYDVLVFSVAPAGGDTESISMNYTKVKF